MAFTLPRDLRATEAFRRVEALLGAMRAPGVGRVVDATDLECSPSGTSVALTAWRRTDVASDLTPTIGIIDVATGELRLLDDPAPGASRRWPRWSTDGQRLLCLRRVADGPDEVLVLDPMTGAAEQVTRDAVRGQVESLAWAPDDSSVALLVAEPGAEISDVFGSGRIGGSAGLPDWAPEVSSDGRSGWRRLWVTEVGGRLRPVTSSRNVWDFCWAGTGQLAVVSSATPEEDAWYAAELGLLDLPGVEGDAETTPYRRLLDPSVQMGSPGSAAGGRLVSVIVGTASDRGLLAGDLVVVDVDAGTSATVPTNGVHVTSQTWCGAGRILVAGLREGSTVTARVTLPGGDLDQEWVTAETFGPGELLPVAAPCGDGAAAVVLESHSRAPTCGVVRDGLFTPLLDLAHPGSAVVEELGATVRPVAWTSSDGLAIDGYVATPPALGDGPCPLVVMVHGGPVWRWRDVWLDRVVQVPLLLDRGYAVLLPNPRGSQGKGEDFVRGIVGEVGGLDVDDILTGVDHLVAEGVTARTTVAVMGTSYGGFLAAWLATRPGRFAAALASSPVTDWVSQHYTTNIPQSDVRFLRGDPMDPSSQYRSRSPLTAASTRTCPVLLTAGLRDLATPPGQALEMHRALVELGVDTDIALYPREGHDVHEWPALLDHCTRMVMWFDHYLRPART